MVASLAGALAKLDRAEAHLNELRDLLRGHLTNLDLVSGTITHHPGRIEKRIRIAAVPPEIQVVAGDVVHNLRSSLDHVANQLVVANGGTPVIGPGGTTFPIVRPGQEPRVAGGVSPEAMNLIRQVQPQDYWLEEHPLSVLQHLWNMDKHRELLRGQHGLGNLSIWTSEDWPDEPVTGRIEMGAAKETTADVSIVFDHPNVSGDSHYWMTLEIGKDAKGEPKFMELGQALFTTARYVRQWVEAFLYVVPETRPPETDDAGSLTI
jgi:hypothetical protein